MVKRESLPSLSGGDECDRLSDECDNEASKLTLLVLPDELLLRISSFGTAQDLIRCESTHSRFRNLPTNILWKDLCSWKWPHYLCHSTIPINNSNNNEGNGSGWKMRYRSILLDLERTEIMPSELEGLEWTFCFLNFARSNTSTLDERAVQSEYQPSRCYFVGNYLFIEDYLWRFTFLDVELIQYQPPANDNSPQRQAQRHQENHIHSEEAMVVSNLLLETRHPTSLTKALELANDVHFQSILDGIPAGTTDNQAHLSRLDMPASSLRFSFRQCVRIADFALHSVARTPNGGWMIWNKHSIITSSGKTLRPQISQEGGEMQLLPAFVQNHLQLISQ